MYSAVGVLSRSGDILGVMMSSVMGFVLSGLDFRVS